MENKILLSYVIYYSLFHTKLFSNDDKIIQSLPTTTFGIFSTIRRSQTITQWPIDIHGCIGYWDDNYNTLTQQDLYNNLLRVAYNSVWDDDRRQYFKPIEYDPDSFIELDFMMNPIYRIDTNSGVISTLNKPFTNKTFGIIIQTKDKTQRATYLPNVFPKISWKKLIASIKSKAGITTDDFDLFAYKINQIKTKLSSLLIDGIFKYSNIYQFTRFLVDNMNPKLDYPFPYMCKNNILEWDSTDEVRNISALGDIIKYSEIYPNMMIKPEITVIKRKIVNILSNLDKYSSQSLSFLGDAIRIFKLSSPKYCSKLQSDLPAADDEFERPEIILGLTNARCNIAIATEELAYNSDDSIFKMNWSIQAICATNNSKLPQNLVNILKDKIYSAIVGNIQTIETNYIAVAFEASCFVYKTTGQLMELVFGLLFELEKRKQCGGILYAFLDANARVDITCHINNGLLKLNYHKN